MAPSGNFVRPTLDRVKESLFNQIRPYISGSHFLDLFSGSGNIGLEAISQGANQVVFVEPDRRSASFIRKNLEKCKISFEENSNSDVELLESSAKNAIALLEKREKSFDILYLDPPFQSGLYEETLLSLADSKLLNEDAWVIAEHFRKTVLDSSYGTLVKFKERRIGDTVLTFFERPSGTYP